MIALFGWHTTSVPLAAHVIPPAQKGGGELVNMEASLNMVPPTVVTQLLDPG